MGVLNALYRKELIRKLHFGEYQLVVIGGGITGAGIALDAASRGLRTALVEKDDFASGTSSKSTKLIHGGLRYLKQFEIALVQEVGRERAVVHRLAPHLVRSEKMLLPLIKGGSYGKILTSFGLMVYDVLAGVEEPEQRKMLTREETLVREPLLEASKVEGGGLYAEYRTDDARLTMEVLKTATTYGADVINYAEAIDFLHDGQDQVTGLVWKDRLTGANHEIRASRTVSAAGPWVDLIREKDHSLQGKKLHLTKGVHIVLPFEKLPVHQSVYFDVPDGRMIFAIPRHRVTYVGTTDTDYHGDLNDVKAEKKDVEYLLAGVNHAFPATNLSIKDVESSWAGLRPLIEEEGKSASQLSRKDEIFESKSGLLSIAGGKLTGYRKMAERVVDRVVDKMNPASKIKVKECRTQEIVLTGGLFENDAEVLAYTAEITDQVRALGLDTYYAHYLVSNYGRQSDLIVGALKKGSNDPELSLALAELDFTVKNESVHTAMDFFVRRTGRLYFDVSSVNRLAGPVIQALADLYTWDEARIGQEKAQLSEVVRKASEFKV